MSSKSKLSVVIDIGTSKIVGLAGRKTEDGKIEIMAVSKVPSKGIKRGVVFNIEEVSSCLSTVINDLEKQLEAEITGVEIAFAGQHMKTVDYRGYRYTADEEVVSDFDINELLNVARNYKVELGFKIVHVIPQSYIIDDEIKEINPLGITGKKLEANYKLLTVPEIHIQNFQRVFDKIGVKIEGITLSPLAISEAALSEDEKEMGSILLDMGAGTTKLAVYFESVLLQAAVIPFAGDAITNDIKEGCSILFKWAEKLKIQYGQALGDFADEKKVVSIPGHNGWEPKEISFKSLAFIIQARIEEIIDFVNFQIEKSGITDQLGAGIVITGGTSNLKNIISLVKFQTGLDVRKGKLILELEDKLKEIQTEDYLTALGLLSLVENKSESVQKTKKRPVKGKKQKGSGESSWGVKKITQGFLNLFDDDEDLPMDMPANNDLVKKEKVTTVKRDEVYCGSGTPESVTFEEEFVVRFTAYTSRYRNAVRNIVNQEAPTAKLSFDQASAQWKRGTNVSVYVHAQHLEIQNSVQNFEWNGKYHILRFDAKVKKGTTGKNIILKIDVIVENLPILFIRPEISLIQNSSLLSKDTSLLYTEFRSPETAFASYAKSDRQMVLARVRSIQIATGINIFLDCLSIKPSEDWKNRLEEEIKQRDIFWLFWSRNAKQSEWVEWEWRTALKHKTLAQIQPHPLESAESAPPPPELSELQFGSLFELYLNANNKSSEK